MTGRFIRFSWRPFAGIRSRDNAFGLLLAAFVFILYLTTLAPSLGFTDAGELAAVAATWGVAHPTGYPLFTLLAGAFARLPLGETVIWRLNLFAALCAAASVFFFFRFILTLLRLASSSSRVRGNREKGGAEKATGPASASDTSDTGIPRAAAAIGALALAVSQTFWQQSTGIEVYSLHLLLVALTLDFFTRALAPDLRGRGRAGDGSARHWALFAFCLGLSFSNHLTTVLLLPGLAWLFFATRGFGLAAWRRVALALPFFAAGLTPYLYLPLRAAASPAFNWGDPDNWERFVRHVSGGQYRGWMFGSLEGALTRLQEFVASFPGLWGYAAPALMAVGAVSLARSPGAGRRLFVFVLLLAAACVFYAVNYDIHDIASYFLLAHAALAAWAARGAAVLMTWRLPPAAPRAIVLRAAALAAAVVAPSLALNHRVVNERDNYAVEDYARNVFAGLARDAVIVTTQWDLFVSAAWYLQAVERVRTDVLVVDREMLRRSWYVEQLQARRPDLFAEAAGEMEAFRRAVAPFERGAPYDGSVIQTAYEAMNAALLEAVVARAPLYVTPEIEGAYWSRYSGYPAGLAVRLFPANEPPPPVAPPEFVLRPVTRPGYLFDTVRRSYATAWVNQAFLEGSRGDFAAARARLHRALGMVPGYPPALDILRRVDEAERGVPGR